MALDFGATEPVSALAVDAAATMLTLPLGLIGDEEAEADAIRDRRPLGDVDEEAESKAMVDDENKDDSGEEHDAKLQDTLGRMEAALIELEEKCGDDYTFIGDNMDFLVKVVGSKKSRRNRLYHWFHLIGIPVLFSYTIFCDVANSDYVFFML